MPYTAAKKRAGITVPFKLHGLRHCYATHLMETGVGLRLAYRHIKTTEIYTHVSLEAIPKHRITF
ncbi:MAG: tyrosine-type recombinase/integrase [Tannerella sp.]|nr:tyrosine-type recombinase/integrase [Tannerella sp.]